MLLGAAFPSLDIGGNPVMIRRWAEGVESLGLNHIIAYEHVIGFDGRDHRSALGSLDTRSCWHEPLVLFGFLAAVTRRVELATGVLVLSQRQTMLVAKQAAEVDVLSGGRLRLGVGIGWLPEEFAILNETWSNRARRTEEQIAVLRTLWSQRPVDFTGNWHHFEQAGISPLPVRESISIWLGTHSAAGLRRVGQLADGWIPIGHPSEDPARRQDHVQQIHAAARATGRDPASIGIDPQVVYSWIPAGSWVDHAAGWQSVGATHLTVTTSGLGSAAVDDHLDALRQVRDDLHSAGLVT